MKKTTLWLAALIMLTAASCKKSDNPTDESTTHVATANDIKVPAGFTWENSRNVNVSVSVTDDRFKDAIHEIAVFDGDPFDGGNQLSQGSATTNNVFTTNIYLSNQVTDLYVVKTAPDKSKIIQKVNVTGNTVTTSIGSTDPTVVTNSTPVGLKVQDTAPTDCNSGCTLPVITTNTSNVDLKTGDVLCITGSNITVNFRNVTGGTVRICGTNVTVQNLNLSGSASLLVAASGSVNLASFNLSSATASLINYGTVSVSANFADNGIFSNYGTFNAGADFALNALAGVFTNNGTIIVRGNFTNAATAVATNNAALNVTGNFLPNANSNFINKCNLTVGGNYTQSSGVKNYSLIKVAGTTTINANAELGVYNSAMLKTGNLIADGSIKGYGSTSFVKITGTGTIRNSGSIISNVQVYAVKGLDLVSALHVLLGATLGNTVYIPQTGCNDEGNGTPVFVDTDRDGVADNLDDYPDDATKAYNVDGATGTVAFEDNWPSKGDFDLNDLVMAYDYTIVTNALNKVVQVKGTYNLLATGGSFNNGFGVEFPIAATNAKNLKITNSAGTNSANFETGQTKAVVILFSDMRAEMATWNTKTDEAVSPTKTYSIVFDVDNGPLISLFSLDEYNPFIWHAGRGHETHVAGNRPTSLADASLFGTADDATSTILGLYYITKTGLPYALNIPGSSFKYPKENIDITQAYLHFGDWAQSAGLLYNDWYSNTANGYRNANNIFNK